MKYKIAYQPEVSLVYFSGNIDEHIGPVLIEIRSQMKGRRVVFDFTYLAQINSIGVSNWLAHIKAFDDLEVVYENCPQTFSSLWLMIPHFGGKGRLASLFAHYYCMACDSGHYHKTLVRQEDCVKANGFPPMPCPTCQKPMQPEPSDQEFLTIFLPG